MFFNNGFICTSGQGWSAVARVVFVVAVLIYYFVLNIYFLIRYFFPIIHNYNNYNYYIHNNNNTYIVQKICIAKLLSAGNFKVATVTLPSLLLATFLQVNLFVQIYSLT